MISQLFKLHSSCLRGPGHYWLPSLSKSELLIIEHIINMFSKVILFSLLAAVLLAAVKVPQGMSGAYHSVEKD